MIQAKRLQVAILIGSTRQGRFAPVIANWFARYIQTREATKSRATLTMYQHNLMSRWEHDIRSPW
jgi:NAD(P)H-dependent FMN reductase